MVSQSSCLLTTQEVAKWLGISPRTVCLWAECSELRAVRVGRQWRFRREDIARWLEESEKLNNKKNLAAFTEGALSSAKVLKNVGKLQG